MPKLYTKIHQYDKKSDSLTVSFASDLTESTNPADYTPYAIQPSLQFPTATTVDELKQCLIDFGKSVVADIHRREMLAASEISTALSEQLAGLESFESDIDD